MRRRRWLASAAAVSLLLAQAVTASSTSSMPSPPLPPLAPLGSLVDNEYIRVLNPDPEAAAFEPNRSPRQVKSGHFVLVKPTPLPAPKLILVSDSMCEALKLSAEDCASSEFVSLFSGGAVDIPGFAMSWATPYALSIYGQEIIPNGAGPQGYGYGDGRAISIGEIALGTNENALGTTHTGPQPSVRYELQLKGAGRTPFCRHADGRAVLRSSAREFVASEAMAALGVPTTRALSLIVSSTERVTRPWYRNASSAIAIGAHRPDRESGGDITRRERTAITTRMAASFLRVGQFELYGRRARGGDQVGVAELEQLARHAIRREYPRQYRDGASLKVQILGMASEAKERFAHLAAEWVRVGYTQSNFNADNCLIGGATVDYGPFGFIERYQANWAMWIGGGQHFSFMNQPAAAGRNFRQFTASLEPLLDADGVNALRQIGRDFDLASDLAMERMWARKLGFPLETDAERLRRGAEGPTNERDGVATTGVATALWKSVEALMADHPTDWTIFWRQLAQVPETVTSDSDSDLVDLLAHAFYRPMLGAQKRERWGNWLRSWLAALDAAYADRGKAFAAESGYDAGMVADAIRRANPKFVPREWMLAEAYEAAEGGDYTKLRELYAVLRNPYDEQPQYSDRFYRRAPDGADQQGGIGWMS